MMIFLVDPLKWLSSLKNGFLMPLEGKPMQWSGQACLFWRPPQWRRGHFSMEIK